MMVRPSERRQQILQDIGAQDIGSIDDGLIPTLSAKYKVSEMTIRRDLKILEENGLIKRTWGGAVLWSTAMNGPAVVGRATRGQLRKAQKEAIARCAVQCFVGDGDIIIMEGGTTVTAMARYLRHREALTVVTNGLHTAEMLQRMLPPDSTVICSGGILRPESSTFVGPTTEQFFREFHARRLFLSATGLTLETGVTDPRVLETQVKRAMVESAGSVVLLLDSSKFGVKSLVTIIDSGAVSHIVTDEGAPPEMVQALREQGVDVIIAPARAGAVS
jgi:DeoR/GlpR family transcriptional regulator of sugar metabolism